MGDEEKSNFKPLTNEELTVVVAHLYNSITALGDMSLSANKYFPAKLGRAPQETLDEILQRMQMAADQLDKTQAASRAIIWKDDLNGTSEGE